MSIDKTGADGVDWAYMVKHLADTHRKAKARSDAAQEARDSMIRAVYKDRRLNQVELAKAAGLGQPHVAKIVKTQRASTQEK